MGRRAQRRATDEATALRYEQARLRAAAGQDVDPEFADYLAIEAALRPRKPTDEAWRQQMLAMTTRIVENFGVPEQRGPIHDGPLPIDLDMGDEDILHSDAVLTERVGRVGLSDIEEITAERANKALAAVDQVLADARQQARHRAP